MQRIVILFVFAFTGLVGSQGALVAADNLAITKDAKKAYEAAKDLQKDAQKKIDKGRPRDAIALIDLASEKLTDAAAELKKIGKTKENDSLAKNIFALREKVNTSRYEFRKRKTMNSDDANQKMLKQTAPPPVDTTKTDTPAAPPPPPQQLAIPGPEEQKEALEQIKEVLADEYKKTAPADQRKLAASLVAQASENEDDPAIHYTLLAEARDAALRGGDVKQAMRLIARINKIYKDVDTIKMGLAAFTAAAKKINSPDGFRGLTESALALSHQAVRESRFADAVKIIEDATKYAARAKNFKLKGMVRQRTKEIQALQATYEKIKPAVATLAAKPEDPTANLSVGRYYAFSLGNWEKGLPLLVKGSDDALASLARVELGKPSLSKAMLALGDAWWKHAKAEEDDVAKSSMTKHAAVWYERALPNLKGLAAAKAKKRLSSVGGLSVPLGDAGASPDEPGATTKPPTGKTTTPGITGELKKFKMSWSAGKKRAKYEDHFTSSRISFVDGKGLVVNNQYSSSFIKSKYALGNFKLEMEGTFFSDNGEIKLAIDGKEFFRYQLIGNGRTWKLSAKRSKGKVTINLGKKKIKRKLSEKPGKLTITIVSGVTWYSNQKDLVRKVKMSGVRVK